MNLNPIQKAAVGLLSLRQEFLPVILQRPGVSGTVAGTHGTEEQPLDKFSWTDLKLQIKNDSVGVTHP